MITKYLKKMYEFKSTYSSLLRLFCLVLFFSIGIICVGWNMIVTAEPDENTIIVLGYIWELIGIVGIVFILNYPKNYVRPLFSELYKVKFVDNKIYVDYDGISFVINNHDSKGVTASDFSKDINGNNVSELLAKQISEFISMRYPMNVGLVRDIGEKISNNMVGKVGFLNIRKATKDEVDGYVKDNIKFLIKGVIPEESKKIFNTSMTIWCIVAIISFITIISLIRVGISFPVQYLLILAFIVCLILVLSNNQFEQRKNFKRILKELKKENIQIYLADCYIFAIRTSKDFLRYINRIRPSGKRIFQFPNLYKKYCYDSEVMVHDGEGHWIDETFGIGSEEQIGECLEKQKSKNEVKAKLIIIKSAKKTFLDVYME